MTDLRKIILRVLLGSLAAAAVLGVLAVLLPIDDVMWRAMFSACAMAVAAGLMLPLSAQVDRVKLRLSALAGVAVIVAEFVLALGAIWLIDQGVSGRVGERLAITMLALVPPAVVVVLLLRLISEIRHRIAVLVGLAAMAMTLLMFGVAIWLPRQWWSGDDWWGTGWVCYLYGIIAAGCLINLKTVRVLDWRWLGVFASIAAAAMAIIGIWWNLHEPSRLYLLLTFAGLAIAYTNLALLAPVVGQQRWLKLGAIGSAVAAALVMSIGVLIDPINPPDMLLRMSAAFTILAGCGALALVVLARLNRRLERGHHYETRTELTLICPRCEHRQSMPAGDHACGKCGMMFRILVQEPHCPHCNYTLYGPNIERCPECGRHIGPLQPAAAEYGV